MDIKALHDVSFTRTDSLAIGSRLLVGVCFITVKLHVDHMSCMERSEVLVRELLNSVGVIPLNYYVVRLPLLSIARFEML